MSKYIKTHKELLRFHGKKVKCIIIRGYTHYEIKDAKIYVNKSNEDIYVCQNKANGKEAPQNFGYKYSWIISEGYSDFSKYEIENRGCSNIELLDSQMEFNFEI